MSEVELKKVWKVYKNEVIAVKDLNLKIKNSSIIAILGPSGAGKTSILKMIAGIEPITRGDILFDGQSIKEFMPDELNVAMVFESYALYPNLTVFENIAFPLRAPRRTRNFRKDVIIKNIEEVAIILQIEELLYRKPSELSGGQRQRVAIGRALVRNPRVMLMDEPIGHLDAKLRNYLRGEFKNLFHKLNTTVFYVTHDYKEAFSIADTICILNKGVIQQIGTPRDIYENPSNDFVSKLIGDPPMNLIDVNVEELNSNKYLSYENLKIKMDKEMISKYKALNLSNNTVRIGVRPHDIKITNQKEDNLLNIPAKLFLISTIGKYNILTLKVGNDILMDTTVPSEIKPAINEKMYLDFKNIYMFKP